MNHRVQVPWRGIGIAAVAVAATIACMACRAAENRELILATTTSVQDTGLLDVLLDLFTKESGYTVKPIAVGTGQAIELGRKGSADILWVHSPDDELQFVAEGYGTNRVSFMHNVFVLLGPTGDPARVRGTSAITNAFRKIAEAKSPFVSRGDQSGTHKKELKIWKQTGITPAAPWYIEVGQGMAQTVHVANEKQAYCLADRSTQLSLRKMIQLGIVSEGDPALRNVYSLILVNPVKFPKVNAIGARALQDFLLSARTKKIVEEFGKKEYGTQLFYYDYEAPGKKK